WPRRLEARLRPATDRGRRHRRRLRTRIPVDRRCEVGGPARSGRSVVPRPQRSWSADVGRVEWRRFRRADRDRPQHQSGRRVHTCHGRDVATRAPPASHAAMIATNRPLVVARTSALLRPNARRVVAGLFVPGYEDLIHGQSRLNPVIGRILELDHADARSALTAVMERFGDRHRDLPAILADHFSQIAHRLSGEDLAASTQLLIGAYLTSEYALEAAALFNPSIVEHPDQTGVPEGKLGVVLSLRAVGEGHRSSIEFRTGVIDRDGTLRIDETSDQVMSGRRTDDALYER